MEPGRLTELCRCRLTYREARAASLFKASTTQESAAESECSGDLQRDAVFG